MNRRELNQTRIRRRHVRPAALHQMTRMCTDSCSTTALTPNTGKAANDAHMHILVKMSSVKPSKGLWLNIKKKNGMADCTTDVRASEGRTVVVVFLRRRVHVCGR